MCIITPDLCKAFLSWGSGNLIFLQCLIASAHQCMCVQYMPFLTELEVCALVADLNEFDLLLISKSPVLYIPVTSLCSMTSSQTGSSLCSISIQSIVSFCFLEEANQLFQQWVLPANSECSPGGAGQSSGCCHVWERGDHFPLQQRSSQHHPRPICAWQEHQTNSLL